MTAPAPEHSGLLVAHKGQPDHPLDVLILPDKYEPAYPKPGPSLWHMSIYDVLHHQFDSDAHFTQYQTTIGRRVKHEALSLGVFPLMVIRVFDVDSAEAHKLKVAASPEWRAREDAKVQALFAQHPGGRSYWTRGGYRIVYGLEQPLFIASPEDEKKWAEDTLRAISYLGRTYGIEADVACKEWARLFRAPHVVRSEKG